MVDTPDGGVTILQRPLSPHSAPILTTRRVSTEKLIGDSCDGQARCPVGSACINFKCSCNSGSRATNDKKYCVDNTRKIVGERCYSSE